MKRLLLHFFLPLMAVWGLFGACVDVEQYDNNPRGNFEALWRIIDEHYCFFDYKKQAYGLDWNAVYAKYAPQFHDGMTEEQFRTEMLSLNSEFAKLSAEAKDLESEIDKNLKELLG